MKPFMKMLYSSRLEIHPFATFYIKMVVSVAIHLFQNLDSKLPPGGGGLYFEGRWVMDTFLKLLSSNLVCKPHLGVNLNLWSQIPPNSLPGGGGLYFGGRWVVATFLKLLSSNLVYKPYLGAFFF